MSTDVAVLATIGDAKSTDKKRLTTLEHYGRWFKSFEWKWWVTFTSLKMFQSSKRTRLNAYLDRLEAIHRGSLSCVIAQEQKTLSGCGKSAGRVHFHLLVGCVADLTVRSFTDLWESRLFGGSRTSGAAAHVEPYDPQKDAAYYCFKFLQDRSWDWDFHNLKLASSTTPSEAEHSTRLRRKLRRRAERQEAPSREDFNPSANRNIRLRIG